jgi:hypothetical protein
MAIPRAHSSKKFFHKQYISPYFSSKATPCLFFITHGIVCISHCPKSRQLSRMLRKITKRREINRLSALPYRLQTALGKNVSFKDSYLQPSGV